jgi:hypothetical protein
VRAHQPRDVRTLDILRRWGPDNALHGCMVEPRR